MAPSRRRVSYVIPPPTEPVPFLQLPPFGVPRHGSIRPLIIPTKLTTETPDDDLARAPTHPRHRLGVMSLAVDTTTQLEGRNAPEGILYTGGRDGLVMSWDLGLPLRRRQGGKPHRGRRDRWEMMTGMADEILDEVEEEDERRDGDIIGDVKGHSGRRRRSSVGHEIPYESQWGMDTESYRFDGTSQFRQCVQTHTDWVNDILLCNYNQTVVSASSDGTIKAWDPHTTIPSDPSQIGSHADYARCLALCREQNWVASGSFDRTIKLWDLNRTSPTPEPLTTLNPPDATAPKSSIYAIAADPFGHAIASGSPERVVRMWDPRSGKRTGKLVGHTDNIRAILISEDARYLLTGSADASVKLWSLSSQRCLHTFTYHTDSVWSLYSSHPSLEVFYSGDKSGIVCKVDVEDCADVVDGTCVVLARDSSVENGEGVNKIAVVDDGLLWTASGCSTVRRWRVPRRSARRGMPPADGEVIVDSPEATISRKRVSLGPDTAHSSIHWSAPPSILQGAPDETPSYDGLPYACLVRLTSQNGPFSPTTFLPRGRDPEVATLYSAASIVSVPGAKHLSTHNSSVFPHTSTGSSLLIPKNTHTHTLRSMRSDASMSHVPHIHELAADATPYNSSPDSLIIGSHGLVRAIMLNDRMHALTVDTGGEVAVWDVVRGVCVGRYGREEVRAASRCGSTCGNGSAVGSVVGDEKSHSKERSPREALEAVRERIEGEAVVAPWSSVDTKTGVLTIHVNERSCFEAEIYADEAGFTPDRHFNDELRLNIGKWVLRNLFLGFIREEQRIRRKQEVHAHSSQSTFHRGTAPTHIDISNGSAPSPPPRRSPSEASTRSSRTASSTAVITSPTSLPAILPAVPSPALPRPSPLLTPMIPLAALKASQPQLLTAIPQSPAQHDMTPMPPRPIRTSNLDPPPSATRDTDYFNSRARRPSTASTALSASEDFSGWGGPGSTPKPGMETSALQTPSTPSAGGLMNRLKTLGKSASRKAMSDIAPGSPIAGTPGNPLESAVITEESPEPAASKTPLQVLLSSPLSPPSSSEAPTLNLPPSMNVVLSDEVYPGWRTVYRGSTSTTWADVYTLEEAMPLWLLEYLLLNKVPSLPVVKISFVLLPWPNTDPDRAQLPELLNTAQSKLTASKFLRVRKLTHHVQDKLDKLTGRPGTPTPPSPGMEPPSAVSAATKTQRAKAEDTYEILCNDTVLSLDTTLAAVRQFFWKQSAELVMHYRLKVQPTRLAADGESGSGHGPPQALQHARAAVL
ncbi:WD40 repeat-like protein [Leucogyrophana mollusca]|uniref:WD40 repeat-like protein n=1 Tax=Leucogyrophana mollusca TaxID=85980 RepID=A0ACB8AX61_9AGAM|nr:WD40 repeat-like protein [Leucogyrophana mollusca]